MRKEQCRELADNLRTRLGNDSCNPVLVLIEKARPETVAALLACCDAYLNTEFRLKARKLAPSPQRVVSFLQEMTTGLRDVDPGNDSHAPARSGTGKALVRMLLETPANPKAVEQLLAEYLLILDVSARDCEGWPTEKAAAVLQRYGLGERHDSERDLLDAAGGRSDLLQFLEGCAVLSREIDADLGMNDPWQLIAVYMRLHAGDAAAQSAAGKFAEVLNPAVEMAAFELGHTEQALITRRAGEQGPIAPFPPAYLEPPGASAPGRPVTSSEDHHSYFATRVAIAALAFKAYLAFRETSGMPDRDWPKTGFADNLLFALWHHGIGVVPTYELRYTRPRGKTEQGISCDQVSLDFGAASGETRVWAFLSRLHADDHLPREYDIAHQWKDSVGRQGSLVKRAQALMSVTVDDHKRLLDLFTRLARHERFGSSAIVALAAKLGCFYRDELYEPSCRRPQPSAGAKKQAIAASQQIDVIVKLVAMVVPRAPTEGSGLVAMTERIYFRDSQRTSMQDGFAWNNTLIDWSLNSDVPGPHVWLYGSLFQQEVDRLIEAIGTSGGAATPEWARLARFIFLVPYVKGRHRLADWKVEPKSDETIESRVKVALKRLCFLTRHAGVHVYEDLARPILGIEAPGQNNILFAPHA